MTRLQCPTGLWGHPALDAYVGGAAQDHEDAPGKETDVVGELVPPGSHVVKAQEVVVDQTPPVGLPPFRGHWISLDGDAAPGAVELEARCVGSSPMASRRPLAVWQMLQRSA